MPGFSAERVVARIRRRAGAIHRASQTVASRRLLVLATRTFTRTNASVRTLSRLAAIPVTPPAHAVLREMRAIPSVPPRTVETPVIRSVRLRTAETHVLRNVQFRMAETHVQRTAETLVLPNVQLQLVPVRMVARAAIRTVPHLASPTAVTLVAATPTRVKSPS